MKNMQIIEIISRLEISDLIDLSDYLESKFLNRSPLRNDTILLFNHLKNLYPNFDDNKISKVNIYEKIYPNKKFIHGKIEKISSELYKLIKEYLIYKINNSGDDSFEKAINISRVLKKLNLNEKYLLNMDRTYKNHIKNNKLSLKTHFNDFIYQSEKTEWASINNKGRDDLNMVNTLNSLILFFESYRLDLINSILIQKLTSHIETSIINPKYFDIEIYDDVLLNNPVLHINYIMYKLLKKPLPTLEDLTTIQELLSHNQEKLSPIFIKEIYVHLRNICTILINEKNDFLIPILHQIQIENLQKGYFYHNNKIFPLALLNITRIACMANNSSWALENIEKHRDKIFGEGDENEYYRINKSLCFHYQQKYEDALDIIPPVCENIDIYLNSRRIEIMCYYDLKSDLIISKIDAFKVYIRRAYDKSLSKRLLDPNKEFINVLIQIMGTMPRDKNRCKRLLERMDRKGVVFESKWLIAKIKELG